MKLKIQVINNYPSFATPRKIIALVKEEMLNQLADLGFGKDSVPSLEVNLLFCDDQQINQLNSDYRKINKPTNCLSFANFNLLKNPDLSQEKRLELGEIVLSIDRIKQEAKEQKKSFKNHLTHLLLHSILHLIGYDHIQSDEAEIMEELEIKILAKLQIPNPY